MWYQIGHGPDWTPLEKPMVLGTVSEGTECETILFPMKNGRYLEGNERVLFERLSKMVKSKRKGAIEESEDILAY
ncbi:hypothetical protein TNCV_3711151 [Trichonephila clavipes]|uniref:Uncharacterized protein n=1 Tax=Trichonephila clavipes TaxID=2585209 RepID=A0A8X6UVT9_TRICX|nr:hypothetical protein TNCV_3711151 [Trichonephila clavipes]